MNYRTLVGGAAALLLAIAGSTAWYSQGRAATQLLDRDPVTQMPPHPPEHLVPTIDGAEHPELIPASVALSLFFETLAEEPNDEGRRRMRAYLTSNVLAPRGPAKTEWREPSEEELDALLALVEEYRAPLADLHSQRVLAHLAGDTAKADALRLERERILTEFLAILQTQVGIEIGSRVEQYVREVFPRKVRMFRSN